MEIESTNRSTGEIQEVFPANKKNWLRYIVQFLKSRRPLTGGIIFIAATNASFAGEILYPQLPDLVMSPNIGPTSRDVAVGMVLDTKAQYLMASRTGITCSSQKVATVTGTSPVPGDPQTFTTNVPGVGVRFYLTNGWTGGFVRAPVTETLDPIADGTAQFYTQAEYVVTGPLGNGVVTTLPSMHIEVFGSCITSTGGRTQYIQPGSTISARTCSVNTQSVSVVLPKVDEKSLPNVGSTVGDTGFNIAINCPAQINVYMTLTDATSPGNRTTNLSLSPDSTAGGAALQVLQRNALVSYGPDSAVAGTQNQWSVGQSVAGVMNIPLSARYVRTGDLKSGSVKASATFTMSYQ